MIPKSYRQDTDGIPVGYPHATGSPPVGYPPSAPQVSVSSSPVLSLVDPDQTHARKSKPGAEVFPVVGDPDVTTWSITTEEDADIRAAYPDLDVDLEYKRALAWVKSDPTHRKTARGMCRFLTNWMARNQNRGGARANGVTHRGHARAEVKDRPSGEVKL